MRVKTSFGNHSASSHSSTCGRSSLATKRRIASRSCSCSSVKGGIGRRVAAAGRPFSVRRHAVVASTLRITKSESGSASSAAPPCAPPPRAWTPARGSRPPRPRATSLGQRLDARVGLARLAVDLEVAARRTPGAPPGAAPAPVGPAAWTSRTIARQKAGSVGEHREERPQSHDQRARAGRPRPSSASASRPSTNAMPVSYIARKQSSLSLKCS